MNDSLIQEFLEYTQMVRGCRPKTAEAYATDLKVLKAYCTDHYPHVDNPSRAKLVVDYIRYLRVERNNSSAAVQRKLATLSAYIDFLILMEILDSKQDEREKWPKLLDTPKRLPVVLETKEMQDILSQPDITTTLGLRDQVILTLIYSTGLRVSEICSLKISDISFKENRILIHGKGGRERYVPLDTIVEESLKEYIEVR